jgi:hypothetical protein
MISPGMDSSWRQINQGFELRWPRGAITAQALPVLPANSLIYLMQMELEKYMTPQEIA